MLVDVVNGDAGDEPFHFAQWRAEMLDLLALGIKSPQLHGVVMNSDQLIWIVIVELEVVALLI